MSGVNYHTRDGKPDPEDRAVQTLRELIREARASKTTGEASIHLVLKDGGVAQIRVENRKLL